MADKPFDHGLMELTHHEVVEYGLKQDHLSVLELELLLRLEQILDARDSFVGNIKNSACSSCVHLSEILLPSGISGEPTLRKLDFGSWQ